MLMKPGDRWHCINPACGCEVLIQNNQSGEGTNPRYTCGAVMKKKYASPVLAYLDFLRVEEAPEVTARKE